jgi:hypothetical protein
LAARSTAIAVVLVLTAATRPPAGPPVDYTKYHTYAELTAELQQLVRSHSSIAKLVALGESRGGRTIWAVEIANPAGVPVEQRPGLLVAANFEGDRLIGSELALFTVDWLLTQYASNAEVKRQIDEQAFYIIPRVNPDGAEAMFASPLTGRRTNLRPFDDDADARIDEDPPEDLNGDGVITVMRVKDAKGPYMMNPAEPRLMKRADASRGETGGWALYIEGTDTDGDGFYNEDGVGGVDLGRNFQHEYPYYAADAGPNMVSEPEARALMEYILAHRGIAAVLTFEGSDNLVSAPNARGELAAATPISLLAFAQAGNDEARDIGMMSAGGGGRFGFGFGRGRGGAAATQPTGRGGVARRPATTVNASDQEYFRTISEKYRELTGIRQLATTRAPAGAFFEWAYYQFGVPSFASPGWGIEAAAAAGGRGGAMAPAAGQRGAAGAAQAGGRSGAAGRGAAMGAQTGGDDNDLRLLRWMDAEQIDGFAPWTPYTHPQLGAVEIGGFKPYAAANPPAAEIAESGAKHAEFASYLASLFAHVRVAETKVTAHGGGVFSIDAEIENTGFLPTAMAQGVTSRSVQPVMVQLGVDPESIITGDNKTNFVSALAGSGNRQSYHWVIRGRTGAQVELKLRSQKSGSQSVTLTLR